MIVRVSSSTVKTCHGLLREFFLPGQLIYHYANHRLVHDESVSNLSTCIVLNLFFPLLSGYCNVVVLTGFDDDLLSLRVLLVVR